MIVPLVMKLVMPASVVDVGCGLGTWLKAFAENGVETLLGIDGDHVDRSRMLIDPHNFLPMDLTRPENIDRRFDLAVCLEVGEHLPARSAPRLVSLLTQTAPAVLFSAALPGQGGTFHINEHWGTWWRKLFKDRGFIRLDPVRRRVWFNERVELWYQQNVYLYVSHELLDGSPVLQEEHRLAQLHPLELAMIGILEKDDSFRTSVRQLFRSGVRAMGKLLWRLH